MTAAAACLMLSAKAISETAQKSIEDRIRKQMIDMIASYDLQSAIDTAV